MNQFHGFLCSKRTQITQIHGTQSHSPSVSENNGFKYAYNVHVRMVFDRIIIKKSISRAKLVKFMIYIQVFGILIIN